ncbi:MAG: hypothetical protein AABX51_04865 [Nanoarchaeota archaeon]
MRIKVLSKREAKELLGKINEQFGSSFATEKVLFLSGDDIYLANRETIEGIRDNWRVNELGLYLGELKGNHVRLSIEGSQYVGQTATQNVLDIDESERARWLAGDTIEIDHPDTTYVIIKCGSDFFGCGKVKGRKLLNFVPKTRRISGRQLPE